MSCRRWEHSSLSKKAGDVPYTIFKKLIHTLVSMCNRPTRRALNLDKNLLVINATMITAGENRLPLALYHSRRSGVKLHIAYTPSTGRGDRGAKTYRPIGPSLNHRGSILVEDRAYFKIQRIDSFLGEKQSFVIRMKENVEIVRPKYLKALKTKYSRVTRDITCQLGSA
ncbi:hypothetical protein [Salibacterium lacus]|uniref:Transposase IS4-like domain-containing protein n=1 Tax=Salibacterium lacus TaxID=1898109 RepID=A0ABW5T6Y5_9BACI